LYVDGKFVWKELEIEIKPYIAAIALRGPLHALVQELAKREAETKEITNHLTSASAGSIDSRLQEIHRFVTAGISALGSLLEREPVLAQGRTAQLPERSSHPIELSVPLVTRFDIELIDPYEAAVTKSAQMVLILSPSSVKSRNVRNEISFALDENNIIIPVLYQDWQDSIAIAPGSLH
jgi:hypothetical protein